MIWMRGGSTRPLIACLMLLCMMSCCASGPASGLCSQISPILIDPVNDRMVADTERQIRELNTIWEEQCDPASLSP